MTADGYNPADGMGLAVNFLKFTNDYVFKMHLESSFGDNVPLSVATLIIVLSLAFFLCTNVPQINKMQKTVTRNGYADNWSRVLIFQLLRKLQFFTVSSLDYGRTLPISLYTSFFLFHYSPENGIKINVTPPLEKAADRLTGLLNRAPVCGNPYFYILVILVFPFQIFMPSLWRDNIIMHLYDKIMKYVL